MNGETDTHHWGISEQPEVATRDLNELLEVFKMLLTEYQDFVNSDPHILDQYHMFIAERRLKS